MSTDYEVEAAQRLAERLLSGDAERLAHSAAVAHRAEFLAAGVTPRRRPVLVAAAWLHDIGYSAAVQQTTFHPVDGAAISAGAGGARRSAMRWPTTRGAASSPSCAASNPT